MVKMLYSLYRIHNYWVEMQHQTNNPNLVTVYVGVNPLVGFQSGALLRVAQWRLAQQVTLLYLPQLATNVYAVYGVAYTLEDQE